MIKRSDQVVIRRESFGGIAFNRATGAMIELDREGCLFLEYADGIWHLPDIARQISATSGKPVSIAKLKQVAVVLCEHGFLESAGRGSYHPASGSDTRLFPETKGYLTAPETVHLALTHRCNHRCRSCYCDLESPGQELATHDVKRLIDEMTARKVFQLAIGGGEPLLREDLVELVCYARNVGVVPNVTTNGSLLTRDVARAFSGKVGQVQLSLNGNTREMHEHDRQSGSFEAVLDAMRILRSQNVRFGINVLLTRSNYKAVREIIGFATDQGAQSVNVLRPKPSRQDGGWYQENTLSGEQLEAVRTDLAVIDRSIRITVDCALSFLLADASVDMLRRRGVHGCAGATRFLSVYPGGKAYPCSFLTGKAFSGGNVLDGLGKVWDEGFQAYRELTKDLGGSCGSCDKQIHCGGCRAVAMEREDFLAGDPSCPW